MKEAFDSAKKTAVHANEIGWRVQAVALPLSKQYKIQELEVKLANEKLKATNERLQAARDLAWARRCEAGHKIDLSCLRIGPAYVVHMPGELVRRIPIGRPDDEARLSRDDGGLRRLWPRLHRHRHRLHARRLRDRPAVARRSGSGSGADEGPARIAEVTSVNPASRAA